ncbi:hypothetical protein ACGFYP_09055 [Streptomyces sp. NPDC048370]|uniref:hypothetical protein n=1 Tax=Streptomyces sp. NPDC048370 TaxID=3365540 RepID=UPI0037178B1F
MVTPADDEDGAGGAGGRRSSRTRKAAELAAVVSAVTALAALVFGLLGVIGSGGAAGEGRGAGSGQSTGQTGEAAPPAESPSASATGVRPSDTSDSSASPSPGSPSPRPSSSPPSAPPPVPRGWHVVRAKALSLEVAVPNGWKLDEDSALQSTWVSPDNRYVIGVKRDSTNGHSAQSAAIGQLAWYRKTAESKMEALKATTHPDRQGGKPAVRMEMDYHWPAGAIPCHRTEIFVAGEGGQVYQLHVNDQQYDAKPSALPQLLATARAHFRTDLTA